MKFIKNDHIFMWYIIIDRAPHILFMHVHLILWPKICQFIFIMISIVDMKQIYSILSGCPYAVSSATFCLEIQIRFICNKWSLLVQKPQMTEKKCAPPQVHPKSKFELLVHSKTPNTEIIVFRLTPKIESFSIVQVVYNAHKFLFSRLVYPPCTTWTQG